MGIAMRVVCCVILVSITGGIGCKSGGDPPAETSNSTTPPPRETPKLSDTPIPPESPFAKLHYGMGMKEVSDLIGPPTDQDSKVTGKAFNPFYYGADKYRTAWYYKGQGRLVFNHSGRLL